jgi:tryptophan 2,3-dioxygenase
MDNSYGGDATLSYNRYLKVHELTDLQNCLSNPVQHNEMLFITIHQTYELWFKQILHEIDAAIRWMNEDRVPMAVRAMKRVVEIEHVLVNQIRILETMTPYGFLLFRDELKPASGFQSTQFREIEFVSGAKDEKLFKFFQTDEKALEKLKKRIEEQTLSEAFFGVLRRRGLDAPADDSSLSEEAQQENYMKRIDCIVKILSDFENRAEEFEMQEALIEHDELISLWRSNHVKMVERMVGFKRGTGGSEGVGYLRKTLEKKFFPELWEARTYLKTKDEG